MASLLSMSACNGEDQESSDDEVTDRDCERLSDLGKAAYQALSTKHARYWHKCWNVTQGRIVGETRQTPLGTWPQPKDPQPAVEHDDWFPKKLCELISKTQYWLDVTSLGPPDGKFMTQFKKGIANVAATSNQPGHNTITIRLCFGNIIGMPTDIDAVMTELTEDIPEGSNIEMWVGAWRKGVSWNHSKIIAVDGKYLHNGGHNLWDQHYLQLNPVHDISMEAEGRVAHDGHLFANEMWEFIKKEQSGIIGKVVAMLPDHLPMVLNNRVSVSEYPEGEVDEFPPMYSKSEVPKYDPLPGAIPLITMGRYGALLATARPSDDAILALFNSAKKIIHMSLQDVGPICIPSMDRCAVPGCVWPEAYLTAWGNAIYKRGVDVEIALSTPGSIPNGLSPTQALYGNGWKCEDVASEIIKTVRDNDEEDIDDDRLRKMVQENLRVCYIKQGGKNQWSDGGTLGNHAKHFIIDDQCYYIGSQNLYVCDLAEWGILIDDKEQTKKCMSEYWKPMWAQSYNGQDCDVDAVMNGLDIDRNGPPVTTKAAKKQLKDAMAIQSKNPGHDAHHFGHDGELDNHFG